uniref:Sperm flagellar protein 1-like protein n=1 Tax=Triatoma infestans TaxID=30076 RepID=A0A170YCW6_TRIIF
MSGDNHKGNLSDEWTKLDELLEWLNNIEFSRPKKVIARDFADGRFMAELLKKYYPRMVELHNYPSANSISNKLKNWQVLNNKVLIPLGLGQSERFLTDVASGVKGTVEHLLCLIKNKIDDQKKKEEKEMEQVIYFEDEPFKSTASPAEFKSMKTLVALKEEEIEALSSKVKHLEALIQLKDQRIDDLLAQVNRCTCFRNLASY